MPILTIWKKKDSLDAIVFSAANKMSGFTIKNGVFIVKVDVYKKKSTKCVTCAAGIVYNIPLSGVP